MEVLLSVAPRNINLNRNTWPFRLKTHHTKTELHKGLESVAHDYQ